MNFKKYSSFFSLLADTFFVSSTESYTRSSSEALSPDRALLKRGSLYQVKRRSAPMQRSFHGLSPMARPYLISFL